MSAGGELNTVCMLGLSDWSCKILHAGSQRATIQRQPEQRVGLLHAISCDHGIMYPVSPCAQYPHLAVWLAGGAWATSLSCWMPL